MYSAGGVRIYLLSDRQVAGWYEPSLHYSDRYFLRIEDFDRPNLSGFASESDTPPPNPAISNWVNPWASTYIIINREDSCPRESYSV
jgi:hypothetical protein